MERIQWKDTWQGEHEASFAEAGYKRSFVGDGPFEPSAAPWNAVERSILNGHPALEIVDSPEATNKEKPAPTTQSKAVTEPIEQPASNQGK